MPCCCWLFQAGIVGTPLQKITKRPIWRTTKNDPSGVKNKRVTKDFSAEEVIRDSNPHSNIGGRLGKHTC